MQSVVLADRDTATVGASKGPDLDTVYGAKDIAISRFGIQKFYFSVITFEI